MVLQIIAPPLKRTEPSRTCTHEDIKHVDEEHSFVFLGDLSEITFFDAQQQCRSSQNKSSAVLIFRFWMFRPFNPPFFSRRQSKFEAIESSRLSYWKNEGLSLALNSIMFLIATVNVDPGLLCNDTIA
jgi:hypothetical protein